MNLMRWLILLLLIPASTGAQVQAVKKARFVSVYDLDATSYTYCVMTGNNGDPWAAPIVGQYPIKTSGSSTTVTEVTTDSLPFALLGVGDQIFVNGNIRYITAKASGASITVNAAVNIENGGSGYPFSWNKRACGTAATDGWIPVSGYTKFILAAHLNQMNAASIDIKWECRHSTDDTNPVNVYPGGQTSSVCPGGTVASNACNYTSAGQNTRTDVVMDGLPYEACRIGLKVNTDDGGDTGADAESITAFVVAVASK